MPRGRPRGSVNPPLRSEGRNVKVLVAAQDVRVRRALTGLLELDGHPDVAAVQTADLPLHAQAAPGLVVLELVREDDREGLDVVRRLALGGHTVIAVCSGWSRCDAVLTMGAAACLDEDDRDFADRLSEAVRATAYRSEPGRRSAAPAPERGRD